MMDLSPNVFGKPKYTGANIALRMSLIATLLFAVFHLSGCHQEQIKITNEELDKEHSFVARK